MAVEIVRRGRSAWRFEVTLSQTGKTCLKAQAATHAPAADGPSFTAITAPDVPPPEALASFAELSPGETPHPFWAHFEGRPARFVPRGEASATPGHGQCWHRLLEFDAAGDPFLDAGRALLLIDTLPWPTFHDAFTERPDYIAPSLDLAVWFHQPAIGSDWLLVDSHADFAAAGLIHGGARVWTREGSLMARGGSQLIVARR